MNYHLIDPAIFEHQTYNEHDFDGIDLPLARCNNTQKIFLDPLSYIRIMDYLEMDDETYIENIKKWMPTWIENNGGRVPQTIIVRNYLIPYTPGWENGVREVRRR